MWAERKPKGGIQEDLNPHSPAGQRGRLPARLGLIALTILLAVGGGAAWAGKPKSLDVHSNAQQIAKALDQYRFATLSWLANSVSSWSSQAVATGTLVSFGSTGRCGFPASVVVPVTFSVTFQPPSLSALCALYYVSSPGQNGGATVNGVTTHYGYLLVWALPSANAHTWFVAHGYQGLASSPRLQAIVSAAAVANLVHWKIAHTSLGLVQPSGTRFIVDAASAASAPNPRGTSVAVSAWFLSSLPPDMPVLATFAPFTASSTGGSATPSAVLTATLSTVARGGSTTLTWTTTSVTSCRLNGYGEPVAGSMNTGPLYSPTTFTLRCTGPNGSVQATATVTIAPPAVTIQIFYANPATLATGGHTRLYWSTRHASGCTLSGGRLGSRAVALAGMQYLPAVKTTTRYSLACTGAGVPAYRTTTVTIAPGPKIIRFSANPIKRLGAGTVTLSWIAHNITGGCQISPGIGAVPPGLFPAPATKTIYLSVTTTFTLTCKGFANQSISKALTVTIGQKPPPAPLPTIISFTASPRVVRARRPLTLSWRSSSAKSCTLNGAGVALTGSKRFWPRFTRTYTLRCRNTSGQVSKSLRVQVIPPGSSPTIVFFTATPRILPPGNTLTLSWRSSNASRCTLVGTRVPTSGNKQFRPRFTSTYTLTCNNLWGQVSKSLRVTVIPPGPLPTIVSFTATPRILPLGNTLTLSWRSSNASRCTLAGTRVPTSGNKQFRPRRTTTYTLTCGNLSGQVSKSLTVRVIPPAPLPTIVSFTSKPRIVSAGRTLTLSWRSRDARRCTLVGTRVPTSGSKQFRPLRTTTYTLTCGNLSGQVSKSLTVRVFRI